MTTPHLIAHVVNAISLETAEVELEIAYRVDDRWLTNEGREVWPYRWQPIETLMVEGSPLTYEAWTSIPHGWLEILQRKADLQAVQIKQVSGGLLATLGLTLRSEAPIPRRKL